LGLADFVFGSSIGDLKPIDIVRIDVLGADASGVQKAEMRCVEITLGRL
jgi:hypothetical protein